MKKILLTLVFVASMATVNAKSTSKNIVEKSIDFECTQAAWDYGTAHGGGNPSEEYRLTDQYYSENCM